MENAPVVLFVYNRADHFEQTFRALAACPEAAGTDLYIFADGAKDADGAAAVQSCRLAVRAAAEEGLFRHVRVTESPVNRGLAFSVIAGVTEVVGAHGSVIVLEDDSVVSPYFLRFMNRALTVFQKDRRIGSIAGYTPQLEFPEGYPYDIFTCYRSCSCGWATWKDRWQGVDWSPAAIRAFYQAPSLVRRMNADGADRFLRLYRQTKGESSSWSVRFGAHLVKNNMLTVYPRYSLIRNIGCDDSGVHSKAEDAQSMAVDLSKAIPDPVVAFVPPDARVRRRLKKHYAGGLRSDIRRFGATVLILCKERWK